jgi:aspartyl-tRNA synthetase
MTLLLRSFPLITLRTTIPSSLPLFQNLLRYHFPKSLPAKRTRALVTLSASSSSPETILKPQQQPNDTLHWVSRTHFCGQLSTNDVGTRVRLCGWVALHRVHGGLTFLNLRDHTGIVQANPFIYLWFHGNLIVFCLVKSLENLGFFSSFLFRLRLRLMNFLMRIRL